MTSGFETTADGSQSPADLVNSWPAHLSRVMSADCVNLATPGADNYIIWANIQAELMLNSWPTEDTLVVIGWTNFYRSHYISQGDVMYINPYTAERTATFNDSSDTGFKAAATAWLHRDLDQAVNDSMRLLYSAQTWLEYNGYQYIWVDTLGKLPRPEYDLVLLEGQPCQPLQDAIFNNPRYYQAIDQYTWLQHTCPAGQVKWGVPSDHQHWDTASLAQWAEHVYAWAKEKGYLK